METGVIEITFTDGRIYRIFFANDTQKRKVLAMYHKIDTTNVGISLAFICTGIHTVNQFEKQFNNL